MLKCKATVTKLVFLDICVHTRTLTPCELKAFFIVKKPFNLYGRNWHGNRWLIHFKCCTSFLLLVYFKISALSLIMDINLCSLCHVRNVVPCISWSSNDSWHFPICFHGVGWDFFTQKITNNLYIPKFLFAPVKFEMKKFECIIYFLLELYSELFFKL